MSSRKRISKTNTVAKNKAMSPKYWAGYVDAIKEGLLCLPRSEIKEYMLQVLEDAERRLKSALEAQEASKQRCRGQWSQEERDYIYEPTR